MKVNGEASGDIVGSGNVLDVRGTGATSVTRSGRVLTITSDNNYLASVSGSGNGTVTFGRQGLSNLTLNLAHTHTIAQVSGLQAHLDSKETISNVENKFETHENEDAPHTYGDKFQWAVNDLGDMVLRAVGA